MRVPKGFDKSISFDLVAIESGSAMPALNWDRRAAQASLPGFGDALEGIVETSYQDIIRLVDDAGNGRFPKSLSSEHIRALNRLGTGLRDNERIEFMESHGHDGMVVYLDPARRKALITQVRETYQARFEGIGRLIGVRALENSGRIEIETPEHGVIAFDMDADRVIEEFDGNLGCDVQIDLQIELDNNDKYQSTVDVYDATVIDAQFIAGLSKCRARLEEIRALDHGWHNGEGEPIASIAIDAADRFLLKRHSLSGAYRIYPTAPGGVLIEFEANGWDLSVEFDPDGGIEIYGVEIDGRGQVDPQSFDDINTGFLAAFDRSVNLGSKNG
jgi:hypothetical protein